jgi:hypothetical protein
MQTMSNHDDDIVEQSGASPDIVLAGAALEAAKARAAKINFPQSRAGSKLTYLAKQLALEVAVGRGPELILLALADALEGVAGDFPEDGDAFAKYEAPKVDHSTNKALN